MLTKFYESWGTLRALLITLTILFALGICVKSHSWNLEVEYVGPGSSASELNEQTRDRQNREAAERVYNGSTDPRDLDRAYDNAQDHAA